MPAFFKGFEADFDDRHANDLAVFFQAMCQIVARLAGGTADPVETSRLTAYCVLKVGAEGQVFTQIAVGIAPVAGGHYPARSVEHIDCPAAAASVQAFKVLIDRNPVLRGRISQQLRNAGLQLQQAGQVGVFAEFALDSACVEF